MKMNAKRFAVAAGLAAFLLLSGLSPALAWAPGEQIGPDLDWLHAPSDRAMPKDATEPKQGEVWIEPVTGMEMLWVPSGCFMMGSPPELREPEDDDDEGPVTRVCLSGFYMGRYEVTNAQYRKFRKEHNSGEYKVPGNVPKAFSLNEDDQPVVNVSWNDAMTYCRWLSDQSGNKWIFSLPTEAEHEYACRAGTTTIRFWGDAPDDACKYANVADASAKEKFSKWKKMFPCDDKYVVTAPVGKFAPNPWGFYDILGNVWEWCIDWKGHYPKDLKAPLVNPTGPAKSKEGRQVRGGSWDNPPAGVRCANRSYGTANFRRYNDGFRVVRIN